MPFPFAAGEILTAANLNAGLQLGSQIQVQTFTPGADTNFDGTGAFTTTFSFSNVTVPTWATTAYVQVSMSRVFLAGTINATEYEMRVGIGGQYSLPNTRLSLPTPAIITAALPTVTVSGLITLSGTWSQAFIFQSNRVAGTGTGRIDVVSDAVGLVIFRL